MSVRFGEPLDVVWGRLAWLRGELSRFTYRPGWRLEIDPVGADGTVLSGGFVLRVSYRAADSYHPERVSRIGVVRPVPDYLGPELGRPRAEEEFGRWLAHELLEVERHESREWLRRDGKVFDDPHVPGARP